MKTALFYALLLSLFLAAVPVKAADERSSLLMMPTTSKTVYLLYRKMTGLNFNAQEILQETDAFKKASAAERQTMLLTQKPLLETEYASLDPQKQVIVIRTAVKAKTHLSPPALSITIDNTGRAASAIYFPYNWAGMNLAVIPDQLEPFLDIPMKLPQVTAATAKIREGSATMVIEMLPLKADATPMQLDGIDQYLLMTKIVGVSYYNQSMEVIWQWQSPDYRRPGAASPLINLKR